MSQFFTSGGQSIGVSASTSALPFYNRVILHHIVYHIFIHPSVDGHLGCFHVPALVNSTAVNIKVHVSF